MTYLIVRDTLIITYLFYNLHKILNKTSDQTHQFFFEMKRVRTNNHLGVHKSCLVLKFFGPKSNYFAFSHSRSKRGQIFFASILS